MRVVTSCYGGFLLLWCSATIAFIPLVLKIEPEANFVLISRRSLNEIALNRPHSIADLATSYTTSEHIANALDKASEKFRRSSTCDERKRSDTAKLGDRDELYTDLEKRQSNVGVAPVSQTASISSILAAATPSTSASLGINQDRDDISYFSTVDFGSSNKSFAMVIDTGSADTWIPSSSCHSDSCLAHRTFGPNDSTTLQISGKPYTINYGSGVAEGVVATDDLYLAGFEVENFEFGLSQNVSDDFIDFPIDGILGLAMSQASQLVVPTLIDTLVAQNFIQKRIFGIDIHRASDGVNDGVINFGGFDPSRIVGGADGLTFSQLVSTDGLWNIALDDIFLEDTALDFVNRSVVLDTGTSLILIPPDDALQVHKGIPNTRSNGEMFYIPCNTSLDLQFQFSGVKYQVAIEDYVGEVVDASLDLCLSLIVGRSVLQDNVWLVGDVFLKNVFTVFDIDEGRVGFGLKPSDTRATATATALALPTDVFLTTSSTLNSLSTSSATPINADSTSSPYTTGSSSFTSGTSPISCPILGPHLYKLPILISLTCWFAVM